MLTGQVTSFFPTEKSKSVTKDLYLHHKINRNAQDYPYNNVNSCYLHSTIIGKDTL